jgi:hypothetical protein
MTFKDINNLVVTSANPCLLIYMLDRSLSMNDPFGNARISKAQALCNAINDTVYEAGCRCISGASGEMKSKFEIALFSYGNGTISSGWEGSLASEFVHPIVNIFKYPLFTTSDDIPKWINPSGNGGTPMLAAFENVKDLCEDWINWGDHRDVCHPPIIINITDGEATDDRYPFNGIKNAVTQIRSLSTVYGYSIIMNIHVSGDNSDKVTFPDRAPNDGVYENFLYEISSPLYEGMITQARNEGYNIADNARGYMFNAAPADLVKFIKIGSIMGAQADR